MKFRASSIGFQGMMLIETRQFIDDRGYFVETWSAGAFESLGIINIFVQDNQSLSKRRGTLRGLHFQTDPFAQAKLIRVLCGAIFDVVVDLRTNSPTFGRWFSLQLNAERPAQLYIPRGFAHGFLTLSDNTVVAYKVDAPYSQSNDAGIAWNDPDLAIDWPMVSRDFIISDKDLALPRLRDLQKCFSAA
jgi:dTDP-4-dehydrorhamnose 3,5-epimerase